MPTEKCEENGEVSGEEDRHHLLSLDMLPNECLIEISRNLSLGQLIGTARPLSTRWSALVRSLTAKRRSLKIFDSHQSRQDYCRDLIFLNLQHDTDLRLIPPGGARDDDLVVPPACLQTDLIALFGDQLFPDIEHLLIYLNFDANYLPHLPEILTKWPAVKTLTFAGNVSPEDERKLREPLMRAISTLAELESINFLCKLRTNEEFDPTKSNTRFYARTQIYSLAMIPAILAKLRFPGKLRKLGLNWTANLELEKLRTSFVASVNVTHLRMSAIEFPYLEMVIARNYPQLRALDIEFVEWPLIGSIAKSIIPLRSLTELRLAFVQILGDEQNQAKYQNCEELRQLPRLANIKTLSLCEPDRCNAKHQKNQDYCSEQFDANLFCAILASIFPAVERLNIRCDTEQTDVIRNIRQSIPCYFSNIEHFQVFRPIREEELLGKHRDEAIHKYSDIAKILRISKCNISTIA